MPQRNDRLAEASTGRPARSARPTTPQPFIWTSHNLRPTIRDYTTLLERIFLLEHLPPWHGNRLGRLVKTPKLHVGDTGLAAALLGLGDGQGVRLSRPAQGSPRRHDPTATDCGTDLIDS